MLRLLGGWFHGLVVISLVDCFRPDLGTVWELLLQFSCSLCMTLFVACVWLVLWSNYGLVVDSLWTEFGTIVFPVGGIIAWPVMACGVA